ncbi:hypothetical protein [Rhizobium sp. F40D2]|uniref:hypothetical protein n=1 Tax=Rhizobium sp. F40D2 TaxID=3453141 RepID=UPI003F2937BF
MQPSLIKPDHSYVSRNAGRRRYVSMIKKGVVAYREFLFGIPISRKQTLDAFARWAHEDAALLDNRPPRQPDE